MAWSLTYGRFSRIRFYAKKIKSDRPILLGIIAPPLAGFLFSLLFFSEKLIMSLDEV